MVKHITGGYKVTYHSEGPEKEGWEVDFTPPFRRVSMIDELEKKLNVQFPDPANLNTEGNATLHGEYILMDSSIWSDTINMGLLIIHIKGLHIRLPNKICFNPCKSLSYQALQTQIAEILYPVRNPFLVR